MSEKSLDFRIKRRWAFTISETETNNRDGRIDQLKPSARFPSAFKVIFGPLMRSVRSPKWGRLHLGAG